MKKQIAPITIIAGICLIGVVIITNNDTASSTQIGMEVMKLLLQLMVIVIGGGVVKWLIDDSIREREKRAAQREALQRILSELVKAYNKAKAVRRMLRGNARDIDKNKIEIIRREPYNSLMGQLNDAQLEFEYYKEYIESDPVLFPPSNRRTKILYCYLSRIEKYLNKCVEEFETANLEQFKGKDQALLKNFNKLQEFIAEKKNDLPFNVEFKTSFHKVQKHIQLMMSHLE